MSPINKFLLFAIFALIVAGQFVPANVQSNESTKPLLSIAQPTATPTSTPTPTPIPIASPQILTIPKLGISAPIEPVSVDFDGRMNMPEDYAKVAWYSPGFKPGENGNAVIAGHLDTTTGAPALFYYLRNLEIGDNVSVTAADGKSYDFTVASKQVYDFDKAPIEQIFGPSSGKFLNLMTCTGWWNQVTHNYSQRLVIYTKLK